MNERTIDKSISRANWNKKSKANSLKNREKKGWWSLAGDISTRVFIHARPLPSDINNKKLLKNNKIRVTRTKSKDQSETAASNFQYDLKKCDMCQKKVQISSLAPRKMDRRLRRPICWSRRMGISGFEALEIVVVLSSEID